jgi:uncharacterized membrane protein
MRTDKNSLRRLLDVIRRAYQEFLSVPTLVIAAFFLLAFASYYVDASEVTWLEPARRFLRAHIFADARATASLLSAIASGIIAVTSITISLLLIAVQQSAGSLTAQVFDQFLRRRFNQFIFGFFVGLALYSLLTLATVNDPFNPILGASLVLVLTVAALYLLIILLYTTINQMRPVEIIEMIHDNILSARERHLIFVRQTRNTPSSHAGVGILVRAEEHGYVTSINLAAIGKALEGLADEVEIVLQISTGSFVAYRDQIAEVKAGSRDEAEKIGECLLNAVHLERQRDIALDPAYGIEQLETIAWTSISTSKSNPAPGLLTIRSLRDILSRWSEDGFPQHSEQPLPIVYRDTVFTKLLGAFETLAVCSSESMQHQNYIEVLNAFTRLFARLPESQQSCAEDIILRILPALGDHVLTTNLDAALTSLVCALEASARKETARAVREAQEKLARSIGKLNSRSTRSNS